MRGERGSISAEYMGVLALAAAAVFALVSLPLGDRIAGEVERLICQIAYGGACPAEPGVDKECLVSSDTRNSNFSVTVAIVTVGNGATLIKEVFADGKIRFTLVDDVEVAAELIAGARARVGRLGFNAAASASAGGKLEGARVFEFTDPDEAADFEVSVRNEGTVGDLLHQITESGFDPFGVKDTVADFVFGEDADDLPEPDAEYVRGSIFADGNADLGAGFPGLDGALEAAVQGAGGAKVLTSGREKGDVELHFVLTAEAAADLGILALGPGIGGKATVNATLLFDNTGDNSFRPEKLTLTGTAGYNGSPLNASQILNTEDLADLSTALESAAVRSSEGSGHQVEFQAELDLRDRENLEATLAMLNPNPTQRALAAAGLVRRFDEDGKLTFQVYETTATDTGVEVAAGAGVGGGGSVDTSTETQDLADAYVREPGGRWQARNCGTRT